MKIKVVSKPLQDVAADASIILFDAKGPFSRPDHKALKGHIDAYTRALDKKTTTREWFCTLEEKSGAKCGHLLLDSADFGIWMPGHEKLKTAAARAIAIARDYSLSKIAVPIHRDNAAALAVAILEGLWLGDFQDTRFKSSKAERRDIEVTFVVASGQAKAVEEALSDAEPVLEGMTLARELVNAPCNVLTPEELTGTGVRIAREHGLKYELLNDKQLEKQGYHLLWNVGRGSENKPRMLTVSYVPKGKVRVKEHIALVGKGMTFDTGGYCIKDRSNMFLMNNDMGGAAAVLGALHAIARLELPVRVTVSVPSAHNAIDAEAYHPGNIITSKNGKTVYIGNTDAEGRLILADAFERVKEEKPDVMLDFATLTGACVMALGHRLAGVFTDDEKLRAMLQLAGDRTGDSVWPMPLWAEYAPELKHNLADLNNITKPGAMGGAIHGGNFLKAFVPESVRWAHVDIAGVASTESRARYYVPGGTGFGVRLIVDFIRQMIAKAD